MYKLHNMKDVDGNPVLVNIIRLSDNAFVPFDPDNSDYQAFLKYQAEGGKVYGADEEIPNGQATQ